MENYYGFMKERIKNASRDGSNCIGTALYICGEIDSEAYYSRDEAKLKLSRMKNSLKPELGYLVLWQSGGVPFHIQELFPMTVLLK